MDYLAPVLDAVWMLIGEPEIPSSDPAYFNYLIIEYAFAGLLLLISVSFIFKMVLKLFK